MPAQIVLLVPLGELSGGIPGQLPVFPGPGAGQLPVFPGGGTPGHLPAPGEPGHPSHPIQPGQPGIPDQGLPVPPQIWPQPPVSPLPPDLESKVVVAVHRPGQDWVVKSYPVAPSQGLPGQGFPQPGPQPQR